MALGGPELLDLMATRLRYPDWTTRTVCQMEASDASFAVRLDVPTRFWRQRTSSTVFSHQCHFLASRAKGLERNLTRAFLDSSVWRSKKSFSRFKRYAFHQRAS